MPPSRINMNIFAAYSRYQRLIMDLRKEEASSTTVVSSLILPPISLKAPFSFSSLAISSMSWLLRYMFSMPAYSQPSPRRLSFSRRMISFMQRTSLMKWFTLSFRSRSSTIMKPIRTISLFSFRNALCPVGRGAMKEARLLVSRVASLIWSFWKESSKSRTSSGRRRVTLRLSRQRWKMSLEARTSSTILARRFLSALPISSVRSRAQLLLLPYRFRQPSWLREQQILEISCLVRKLPLHFFYFFIA